MASSTSSATSAWPPRMCDCGFGHCVVKISRSAKNPGHAFYVCPRNTRCVSWVGWCDEFRSTSLRADQAHNDVDQGLRADVARIDQSLRQDYSWQQTEHHPVHLQSIEVTLQRQPNPSQSTNANSTATIRSCFFNSSLLKWKVVIDNRADCPWQGIRT
ncbi:hypothetical protein CsSME_00012815 [Camellia sinensis var. sinensis]